VRVGLKEELVKAQCLFAVGLAVGLAAPAARAQNPAAPFIEVQDARFEVALSWWLANMRGNIGIPRTVVGANNTLSFTGDLGLGRTADAFIARSRLFISEPLYVLLEYWRARDEGRKTLRRDFFFDDTLFLQGSPATTVLEAQFAEAVLGYRIILWESVGVFILGGVNVNWFRMHIDTPTASGRFSLTQVRPLIGITGQTNLFKWLSTYSRTAGYIDGCDTDNYLLETEISLRVKIVRGLRAVVGYKSVWLQNQDLKEKFAFRSFGPFFGLNYAF